MGCYVNPQDTTKEDWLTRNAQELKTPPHWDEVREGWLPVCLIDNGMFTAAGVAYDERELVAFCAPTPRPRKWYVAPIAELRKVSPIDHYMH